MSTASRLTRNGFDMLAAALAGQTLTFTKMEVGDCLQGGEIKTLGDAAQFVLTSLVNPRMTLAIAGVENKNNGTALVTARLTNENLTQGVALREIGLFAKVGTGKEKLYSYWQSTTNYEFLATPDEMTCDLMLSVATIIDSAENITATIDVGTGYVTRAEWNLHINDTAIHSGVLNLTKAEFLSAVFD